MMRETEMTFEEALIKLETIVEKLELADVPLEKAIDYYQEGMKLSTFCDKKLATAKEKMTEILNEDNEVTIFKNEEE